ncbi:MAG: hypothetical protein H8E28_08885 [Anaerolineae bacterium]|nr:hypothetical protein [Anaerolineae bacterium]
MNTKKIIILLSISILLLLVSGCDFPNSEGEETLSAEKILTAVAETVSASLSLTPPATETSTPTATATETVTPTASPTFTSSPTTAPVVNQPSTGGCDSAAFVSDVTIPDGTVIAPGAAFTKTWRIQNAGTCTWNTSYAVVFVSGTQMGGASPQLLTADIAPGSSVDISVAMTAPATAGSYTGYWQLKNAAGVTFAQSFYVQIQVGTGATPTATATGPTPTPTLTPTGPTPTTGTGQPDLRITGMTFDPSPQRGKSFTIRVVVENKGNADAGPFLVEWWSDQGNDDAATKTTWNVASLAAGNSKTLEYTYSAGYDNSGTYTSKTLADANSQVAESDEGNNTMTSSVTVP